MKRMAWLLAGISACTWVGCGSSNSGSSPPSSSPPVAAAPSMPPLPGAAPSTPPATPATGGTTPMGSGYPSPMSPPDGSSSTSPMQSPNGYPPVNTSPMAPANGSTSTPSPNGYPPVNTSPMAPANGSTSTPSPNGYPPVNSSPMSAPAGGTTPMSYPPGGTTPMSVPPGGTAPMSSPPDSSGYPMSGTTSGSPMPMPPGYPPVGTSTPGYPMPNSSGYPMPNPAGYPMPGANGQVQPPAKLKTLEELATEAFQNGEDREGFHFLYAAALVEKEAGGRLPEEFRWIPYLKRPAMAVRWGIGVSYSPPKGYTDHPCPIGYQSPEQAGGNQPGGASAGSGQSQPRRSPRVFGQRNRQQQNQQQPSNYNGQNQQSVAVTVPSDPAELLEFYTGELGEKIMEVLVKRMEGGKYGDVLQRVHESYEGSPEATNTANPMNPMGYPSMPMVPGGPPGYPNPNGEAKPAAKEEKYEPGGVVPGVVMLGEGSERALLAAAERQEVDFVILFDIKLRASTKGTASHTTSFKVMSLERAKAPKEADADSAKPREIFSSKSLNNHRTEKDREEGKPDPVEAEIEGFVAAIDADVTTAPLPEKLSADIALKRATFLAGQETANPLANLAEMQCYYQKKLLTKQQVSELFGHVLGTDQAKKLLSGKNESDRRAALAKWLPKIPEAKPAAAGYPGTSP